MIDLQVATKAPSYDTFIHSTSSDQELETKYTTETDFTTQYSAEDDRTTIATSPTSSWSSSQRSSYSSVSSASYHNSPNKFNLRKKHCQSFPLSNGDKSILYPTKEAAYKRIEKLEEQIELSRHSNEAIVKRMSQAIQTFLGAKRSNLDLELPSSKHSSANEKKLIEKDEGSFQHNAGRLVLEKLTELKEIVDRDGGSLTLNKLQAENIQSQVFFSTQAIDRWIGSVIGHKQSPKQDLKNEVVASEREKRLIEGLKRLSRQKKAAHHEAVRKKRVHIVSLQAAFEKQKKQLRRHLQSKLNNNRQEQSEMEQVLDDMRRELEVMIKELNQSKQQREHSEQKSKRLQDGLKALQSPNTKNPDVLALQSLLQESEAQVDHLEATNQEKIDKLEQSKQDFAKESSRIHATHTHQINALVFEKEELRARLIQAAKSAAEHNSELEEALRRTVAERDAELAKTKLELEKSKRHYEQLQKLTKKQMQLELDTRLNELKSSLKLQHRKEVDTYQLGLSRELRNMSGQIVELETELQDLERQHLRDIKSIQQYKPKLATLEKELMNWKDKEAGLKSELMKSNQKVSILEEEALVLFSKNLELAQRLSGLDS